MCADAPDTSGMNQAAIQNAEVAREQVALAREQAAKAEARQKQFDPLFQKLIESSMASQKTQDDRSAEQWQQYLKIGMPAENRLAETATNYDTPERRMQAAEEARAGVEREGNAQRLAQTQALGRAGVSLSSGRALTLDNASRLQQAKAGAGAAQAARDKVEATGMSLTDNVAKFGRGMTSTGLQAASLAQGAGGQAAGQLSGQQATYNASLAPTLQAYGGATGASTAAGNLYGNIAQLQQAAGASGMSGLLGLGQLAGTVGSMFMASTKKAKTKRRGARSLGEAALEGMRKLPAVEAWEYKPGLGDSRTHVGEYAEDARHVFGERVAPGGKMLSVPETGRRNKLAIAALAARVDEIEHALDQVEAA